MECNIERSFYSNDIVNFINQESDDIQSKIQLKAISISPTPEQSYAWKEQIIILKDQLKYFNDAKMIFEYTIPRVGKRVDNIVLLKNIVFIIEFKCGEKDYKRKDLDQVFDYALDLKYFHKESDNRLLVPILVCTEASGFENKIKLEEDKIIQPLRCNKSTIEETIKQIIQLYPNEPFLNPESWINSDYCPVPTIIEAAAALYNDHSVEEISRHDANLDVTSKELDCIINYSKEHHRKSICFVTGVPGAGKTLVGLNLAISYSNKTGKEKATYFSGNGPLVKVLNEALIRDKIKQEEERGNKISKSKIKLSIDSFIYVIHKFRDYYIDNPEVTPNEHIAIFDESQRAWTKEKLHHFMKTKKGKPDIYLSEPESLIENMNRHRDWATIVCLVGGGQEIYNGEAGLPEWFDSLKRSFKDWDVYAAPELNNKEYCRNRSWNEMIYGLNVFERKNLHLPTSIRSFRTPDLSSFIDCLLDVNKESAIINFKKIEPLYPIYITRDLNTARKWVKEKSRGSTRYGIVASSKAMRLKPSGLFIKSSNDIVNWILGDKEDVRSSYYLEEAVTEFDIQGLEIDYTIVAWDADLRFNKDKWEYYDFKGTKWTNINKETNKLYLKNTYRVLLTRARQGMIIFVPEGNDEDKTRNKKFYDGTFNYLLSLGIKQLQ